MAINFIPLQESHFPLMLDWLSAAHVKEWWDYDITYTMDLVTEKWGLRAWGTLGRGSV